LIDTGADDVVVPSWLSGGSYDDGFPPEIHSSASLGAPEDDYSSIPEDKENTNSQASDSFT